jgi:hypothetical protein
MHIHLLFPTSKKRPNDLETARACILVTSTKQNATRARMQVQLHEKSLFAWGSGVVCCVVCINGFINAQNGGTFPVVSS